jgi:hypothetical protein
MRALPAVRPQGADAHPVVKVAANTTTQILKRTRLLAATPHLRVGEREHERFESRMRFQRDGDPESGVRQDRQILPLIQIRQKNRLAASAISSSVSRTLCCLNRQIDFAISSKSRGSLDLGDLPWS